jgi:hypothetical protein
LIASPKNFRAVKYAKNSLLHLFQSPFKTFDLHLNSTFLTFSIFIQILSFRSNSIFFNFRSKSPIFTRIPAFNLHFKPNINNPLLFTNGMHRRGTGRIGLHLNAGDIWLVSSTKTNHYVEALSLGAFPAAASSFPSRYVCGSVLSVDDSRPT